MLTTTRATISVNGAILSSSRDDFLTDVGGNEAFYNANQDNLRSYGIDLMMFAEGDLFVNTTDNFSSKDLKEVGGLLNYAQAVTHRLVTDRGTHPEDRFFGVPWRTYLGQTYVSKGIVSARMIAEITEELYKDRRTKEVVEVKADFKNPTTVEVTCSVIPLMFKTELINISFTIEDRE
jgi:hypothetical protein